MASGSSMRAHHQNSLNTLVLDGHVEKVNAADNVAWAAACWGANSHFVNRCSKTPGPAAGSWSKRPI